MKRRGLMFILSSPSGAGKTTLSRGLLVDDGELTMSVSYTTRPPRRGERDGLDYHFVSEADFVALRADGGFIESAHVFAHEYGTPYKPVREALARGRDIMFDIDWQGTQQLVEKAPDDVVRVFVLPPSAQELERRLMSRNQDGAQIVAARMRKAHNEISHYAEYDYVIINHDAAESIAQLRVILAAERLRRRRQSGLSDFVQTLYDELGV